MKNAALKAPEAVEVKNKKVPDAVKAFEEKRVGRGETMREALVAKFRFLKEDLLAPKRSKFEASSQTLMNDFLRRMIVENPEEVTHSYAEHLVRFDASTSKEDFVQFATELGVMKSNVIRILGVIKKNPRDHEYIHPMEQFNERLDLMIATANSFAAMSDEDREKALSGDKDGLTTEQKYALDERKEVELMKNRVYKKAQHKEDKMKTADREMMASLDLLLTEDIAKEKADKKVAKGKVVKFSGRKLVSDKRGKGGRVKVGDESIEKGPEGI